MKDEYFQIDEEKTVCFTGHRKIKLDEVISVYDEIEKAIHLGYRNFLSGGAKGFDIYAGLAVLKRKNKYPDIKLFMILPFKKLFISEDLKDEDRENLYYLCDNAERVIELSEKRYKGCFRDRNLELVRHSNYCIAYCHRKRSGTAQTIRFMTEKDGIVSNIVFLEKKDF